MILAAKPESLETKPNGMDKAIWIVLILLGFMIWWPFGLAMLAYLFWSGKMRCCHSERGDHAQSRGFRAFLHTMGRGCCSSRRPESSTGNSAFDEYRKETLRRLEEDQREFMEFLERLRRARDRAEFDEFMAQRNRRPNAGEEPTEN